eukprot:55838-Eustigmatos_ZCMA.PRE.1
MGEEACVAFGQAIDAGVLERLEVISVREVDFDLRVWKKVMRQVRRHRCEALREVHVAVYEITDSICTAIERAKRKGMFPNLR